MKIPKITLYLHAVWVYKKHPYKKRIVDFLKIKKRQLSIHYSIRNANYFKRQRRKEKATVLKSKLLFWNPLKAKAGDEDHSLHDFVENEKKIQINALQMANSWKI